MTIPLASWIRVRATQASPETYSHEKLKLQSPKQLLSYMVWWKVVLFSRPPGCKGTAAKPCQPSIRLVALDIEQAPVPAMSSKPNHLLYCELRHFDAFWYHIR